MKELAIVIATYHRSDNAAPPKWVLDFLDLIERETDTKSTSKNI